MWIPILKRRLLSLLEIAILLAGVATVAGYLGKYWWLLDLASHFRLQYLVILLFASILAALVSRKMLAGTRLPVESLTAVEYGPAEVDSALAQVRVHGQTLTIIGTHPLPPSNAEGAAKRDQQLRDLCAAIRAFDMPTLLIGDLNATPWSAAFKSLIRCTGMRDAAAGRGLKPTWKGPFRGYQIPLDHALVTDGIQVLSHTVGPDVGSDHYPVEVSIAVDPAPRSRR